MEFNEKLQQLRKQSGFTQEELAEKLFVSRTAISKWESGRGLPNIDSLKAISKLFVVTIDELLSGEELIQAAEEEQKDNAITLRAVLYGLIDLMSLFFLFIPLFGERNGEMIELVSLSSMKLQQGYITTAYISILVVTILFGILEMSLQNFQNAYWKKNNSYISMILTVIAIVLFIISQQPYVAFFELWFLVIKGILYIKQHRHEA